MPDVVRVRRELANGSGSEGTIIDHGRVGVPELDGGVVIVVVGESLVDLVDRGTGSVETHVGGSPLNVASGLAQLGIPVTLGTTLGADAHGAAIRGHLSRAGVVLNEMAPTAPASNVARARLDADGAATYDFSLDWSPVMMPTLDREVVALHTGSLGTALRPGAELVVDALEQERRRGWVTLTYDPNIRPSLLEDRDEARRSVESIVGLVDVVKASQDDLDWLYPGVPYADVAAQWLLRGPSVVVVTLGAHGAYAATAHTEVQLRAPVVPVVDTVGAGDSFMAGLLYALHRLGFLRGEQRAGLARIDRATLDVVVSRAIEVASVTVGRAGAHAPTLTEAGFVPA